VFSLSEERSMLSRQLSTQPLAELREARAVRIAIYFNGERYVRQDRMPVGALLLKVMYYDSQ
jgi:hypothetical protein